MTQQVHKHCYFVRSYTILSQVNYILHSYQTDKHKLPHDTQIVKNPKLAGCKFLRDIKIKIYIFLCGINFKTKINGLLIV